MANPGRIRAAGRAVRISRGISQAELAARLRVERTVLAKYEAGALQNFWGTDRLLYLLGVTAADLAEARMWADREAAQGRPPNAEGYGQQVAFYARIRYQLENPLLVWESGALD